MNKENWPSLNAGIRWSSGVLVDKDIKAAMANHQLILDGDPGRAKYATYELVIGDRIEELVMDDDGDPQRDLYRVKSIPESGEFAVLPGQTFKIYSKEKLYMPADVTAIAIPVGIMYKLGLHPETTFADPGFDKEFFVTICNYSPRVVKLRVGEPLARMFFLKLRERPERIHEGSPRDIPPSVERVPRPSDEDLLDEGTILSQVLQLVDPPHYQHAFVTSRIVGVHRSQVDSRVSELQSQITLLRWVLTCLGVVVVIGAVIAVWKWLAGEWPGMAEGILASLVASGAFAALIWAGPWALRWAREGRGEGRDA